MEIEVKPRVTSQHIADILQYVASANDGRMKGDEWGKFLARAEEAFTYRAQQIAERAFELGREFERAQGERQG
jgi:hypothetical protein